MVARLNKAPILTPYDWTAAKSPVFCVDLLVKEKCRFLREVEEDAELIRY